MENKRIIAVSLAIIIGLSISAAILGRAIERFKKRGPVYIRKRVLGT